MTINGTDISVYNARQWNVEPAHSEVENESEWPAGMINPFLLDTKTGLKKYKVSLLVKGETRQKIWENAAKIIAELLEPAKVKLDGLGHNYAEFIFVLLSHQQKESSRNRFHLLELELAGYEEATQYSTAANGYTPIDVTYTNIGTIPSPCEIEVMLYAAGEDTVTISGLIKKRNGEAKDLVIKNVKQLKKIKIDEKGNATEDGESKNLDVDMYALPTVYPGTNKITVKTEKETSMGCLVGVLYKPRYL